MEINDYPIPRVHCGAKTRLKRLCRQPAMPNGKCRLHGGKSLAGEAHGRYITGMFTRAAIEQRKYYLELLRAAREIL